MAAITNVTTLQVAIRAKLRPEQVQRMLDVITAFLEEGTQVRLMGFGTLTPVDVARQEKPSPLVASGVVVIPAGRIIKWRMDRKLKLSWRRP